MRAAHHRRMFPRLLYAVRFFCAAAVVPLFLIAPAVIASCNGWLEEGWQVLTVFMISVTGAVVASRWQEAD